MKHFLSIAVLLSASLLTLPSCKERQDSQKAESVPKYALDWQVGKYVDKYNMPTGGTYEYAVLQGSFSNSATTLSPLVVALGIDKRGDVSLKLVEYGTHLVKDKGMDGSVRDADGNTAELYLYFDDNGDASLMSTLALRTLESNGRVDFFLREQGRYGVPSTYHFSVPENSGFKEAKERVRMSNADDNKGQEALINPVNTDNIKTPLQ